MDDSSLEAVRAFRRGLYGCLRRRRDALFELTDALLGGGGAPVQSLAHASLAPGHRRGWGSVYAALRRGEVDEAALRALLARHFAPPGPGEYAVDVSVWPRPDAPTSPERAFVYHPAGDRGRRPVPVVEGWAYQWVVRLGVLGDSPTSWTAPVDARRVRPTEKATQVAAAQIRALVGALPPPPGAPRPAAADAPLFALDAGYDAIHLMAALAGLPAVLVVRVRSTRRFFVLSRAPAPPAGGRVAPAWGLRGRHASRFVCADPATWHTPTRTLVRDDPVYGRVEVKAWAGLHAIAMRAESPRTADAADAPPAPRRPRGTRTVARGTVLRVQLERLPRRGRTPPALWLWWQGPPGAQVHGPTEADLDRAWRAYARRYDLEQTFRFAKQRLAWTTPRVRLPEQADRWTWLVAAALAQLVLARGAVADCRLPWERALPADRLTPTRVLRAFVTLAHRLPRVAAPPRPCGRSPGRPKGRRSRPAPRHPPVRKAA